MEPVREPLARADGRPERAHGVALQTMQTSPGVVFPVGQQPLQQVTIAPPTKIALQKGGPPGVAGRFSPHGVPSGAQLCA
jgi:hypothetical protein